MLGVIGVGLVLTGAYWLYRGPGSSWLALTFKSGIMLVLLAGSIAGIAPVLGYTALSLGLVRYVTTLFKLSTLMTGLC